MKNLLLTLFIIIPLLSIGQGGTGTYDNSYEKKISTTMTEWKYCTIGYKTQMESGLDPVKKGYSINEVHTYSYDESTKPIYVHFIEMVETESKTIKAVIVVVDNTAYNYNSYYCIPNITFMNEFDVGKAQSKQNYDMASSRMRLLLQAYTSYIRFLR
jgi:hypothetical protein